MVERADRMWSTGEGNSKPLQYSCFENPMNSMKRQKDMPGKSHGQRSLVGRWSVRCDLATKQVTTTPVKGILDMD